METIVSVRKSNGSRRVQVKLEGKSKVEQSHRDQVNINTIVAKAKRSGMLPLRDPGSYGDFSSGLDFHEIQGRLVAAEQDFLRLPSELRDRFGNDVGRLIDFVADPGNAVEAQKLGLLPVPVAESGLGEIVAPAVSGSVVEASGKPVVPPTPVSGS